MSDFFGFMLDHWILSSAFVALTIALIMTEFKGRLLGFKEVKPADAVRLINQEEAVVIDVRDENDYKHGHIINALHIPVGRMEARLGELEPFRDRPIIVACRTGQTSARAGVALNKQGFKTIYKLAGGMMAWQSANLPVTKR